MAELDHLDRLLASYRTARRAPPELQLAVRARLARELAAPRQAAQQPRRGRTLVIAATALALAAGLVLVWQSLSRPRALARDHSREQAGDQLQRPHGEQPTVAPGVTPAELPHAGTTAAPVANARTDAISPPGREVAPPPVRERDARASALAAELAGLEAIRTALANHHADQALTALAAHRVAFPSGQLLREREALMIEALCQHGDEAAAQTRARSFARTYPESTTLAKLPRTCR